MTMALDPNISLQVKPLQLESPVNQLSQALQIQQMQSANQLNAMKMQEAQRAIEDQNALRAAIQPGFDPTNPEHVAGVYRAAPTLAPAFVEKMIQSRKLTGEVAAQKQKAATDMAKMARDQYLPTIQTVDQAHRYIDYLYSRPELQGTPATAMPIQDAYAAVGNTPESLDNWRKQEALGATEFIKQNAPKFQTQDLGGTGRMIATPGLGGPATVVPGSEFTKTMTPGERAADARARQRLAAESETGNYSPATIEFLANQVVQGAPLPPLGIGAKGAQIKMAILDKAREIATDGGKTSEQAAADVVGAKQTLATKQQTMNAFAKGPESRTLRSLNTVIDHLDTMRGLAADLSNSDVRVFNRAANLLAQETGQAAPTNFNAAKQIVGQEIVKAIVANGGSQAEREDAARIIDRANSPVQLEGAFKTVEKLMGGQLQSLRQQYETGTGLKDFDKKLTPRAREVFSSIGATKGTAAPTRAMTPEDTQALEWAKANPKDPRAAAIRQHLGTQ